MKGVMISEFSFWTTEMGYDRSISSIKAILTQIHLNSEMDG